MRSRPAVPLTTDDIDHTD